MKIQDEKLVGEYLSSCGTSSLSDAVSALRTCPRNVQVVLLRQVTSSTNPSDNRPVCQLEGEDALFGALRRLNPLNKALFTLARIYDEAHIMLCKQLGVARRGRNHNAAFLKKPCVDVSLLAEGLVADESRIQDSILLAAMMGRPNVLQATWNQVVPMSFDGLPVLPSLADLLPGEKSPATAYAGVGGGGGSDIVSASLLGHLLRRSGKEMELLVSTRTWRTGSQGKKGSKVGIKREIRHHGGPATVDGKAVGGTYRITQETQSEGRDLETIPVNKHKDVFIVLDQGEESANIADEDKAELPLQFRAVLAQHQPIDTIVVVDTGGDVFGGNSPNFSTPDQDIRVQRAMSRLVGVYPNLITAVLAPGVDAPDDAPQKAKRAGGMVYKPSKDDVALLLDLLVRQYGMDGSNPERYGKTTLCLQERLKGQIGWTSINLPEHVVDTWENPWSSFVFIRECMSDIILMPLVDLLPLIDPHGA